LSLWTTWFTVQPEETGVVQRFGKVIRTAGPGLHFKLPLGVEKVRLVPTARVLKEEFGFRTVSSVPGQKTQYDPHGDYKGESLMLTGDLERYRCTVDHPIPYRRSDPLFISGAQYAKNNPRYQRGHHAAGGGQPAWQRCADHRPGGGRK
jgi:membrane protease subunit HflK